MSACMPEVPVPSEPVIVKTGVSLLSIIRYQLQSKLFLSRKKNDVPL